MRVCTGNAAAARRGVRSVRLYHGKSRRAGGSKHGFSVAELLLVVFIMGVVAAVGFVSMNLKPTEAEAAARTFAGDVFHAESEAIARPDLGCIVKLDTAGKRYWLARPATPDTPITNPVTNKPYLVTYGSGAAGRLIDVAFGSISLGGDSVVQFDGLGSPDQTTDATVEFTAGGETYNVRIAATSGIVTVSRGTVVSVGQGGQVAAEAG